MGGGWMWGHGWSWGGWLVMCLVVLVLWVGLVTAAVLGIRYLGTTDRPPVARDVRRRPEDVLAERYAEGLIDDEEFRHRSALLREHRVTL